MNQNNYQFPSFLQIGNYTLSKQSVLGKGATGTVYRGFRNQCKSPVAIKAIDLATIKDQATRSLLQNQKNALRSINGQHIIKLFDIIELNNFCYIVTQLCEGTTLRDYILEKGRLTEEQSMGIFRKILIGCNAITQSCIIHRDLKPANILISKDLTPTIIDFGFCEIIRAKKIIKAFNVGSPSYMSPQAYLRTLYSEKSDSWSLGMILYEMIHGKTLDDGMNIKDFFELVKNNSNYIPQNIDSKLNANVRQILQKSLKYQTEQRMSISGMKYLTDVYCLKKKNQAPKQNVVLNSANLCAPTITPKYFSASRPPLPSFPKPQERVLQNISNQPFVLQTPQLALKNYQKFNQFPQTSSFDPTVYNKTSQISQGSTNSSKNSCIRYTKIQEKTNDKQQVNFMKNSTIGSFQTFLSNREIERPRGPPVFRQITVRYL